MGEVISKEFYDDIKKIINESRHNIRKYVNTTILFTYWNIGKKIVEFQGGEEKAKYGDILSAAVCYLLNLCTLLYFCV